MKELITPEVVEKTELDNIYSPKIKQSKSNLRSNFNYNKLKNIPRDREINLTQNNIDNRKEFKIHNEITTNNTTTNNTTVEQTGFLRLLFFILILPFKILKSVLKWLLIDSGFYQNFKLDQLKRKQNKINLKIIERCEKIYSERDEVY